MAQNRCVTVEGLRLYNAHVCLFDNLPAHTEENIYKRGIFDACHKLNFPRPKYCKSLAGGGTILATTPCYPTGELLMWVYQNLPGVFFPSEAEALNDLFTRDPVYTYQPDGSVNETCILFNTYHDWWAGWTAYGRTIAGRWTVQKDWLLPEWLIDPDVYFSLSFHTPNYYPYSRWLRIQYGDASLPCLGGVYESPIDKVAFYKSKFVVEISYGPVPFNLGELYEMPLYVPWDLRGHRLQLTPYAFPNIVVRRGLKKWKVCWPESVFKTQRYAAIVDGPSNTVVSPMIKM